VAFTAELTMGPRTYIRGNPARARQPTVASSGFNGAADLHPRKQPTRNPLRDNLAQTSLREVF